jgi:predicted MFS family arabinose efflux permease
VVSSLATSAHAARAEALHGAWIGVLLLWLINILKNIDRVLMGVLAPSVKVDFALSDAQLGMLPLAFSLAYAIAGMPFGRLADTYARTGLIAVAVAFWSVMTAVCGVANNFWILFGGRVGTAIGEAGYLPAAITMISDYFSPRLRNLAIGLLFSGSAVGVFAGLSLGGWLAQNYGWRTAFLGLGLPGLLLAAVAWFLLRDPPRGQTDTLHYEGARENSWWTALQALARNRLYVWILIASAFNTYAHLGMVQWLPSFFQRSHHMSIASLGIGFGTAFSLGMLLGHLCGGAVSSRVGHGGVFAPLKLSIWCNVLAVPVYLLALWLPNPTSSLGMIMFGTFLVALVHPAQATAEQNALSPHLRGIGHASKALAVSIVTGFLPYFVGVMSDGFEPAAGEDSLRWALSIGLLAQFVAALAGWRAYTIGRGWETSAKPTP